MGRSMRLSPRLYRQTPQGPYVQEMQFKPWLGRVVGRLFAFGRVVLIGMETVKSWSI